jgi:hypothetical protein
MKEIPAKGVKGFILYNPFDKNHFFRVYSEGKSFKDYKICAEDIEIEILDAHISLYEYEGGVSLYNGKLDYSSKLLGRYEDCT